VFCQQLLSIRNGGSGSRNSDPSPSRLLHLVVNLDDTVREPSHGLQAEWHMPMAVSDQRYTLADERRDHTDDEIVDGPFVKERSNDLAAARLRHRQGSVKHHCQAVPQRELVRKSCSFITFYFYVLSLEYPQALSSSI